jgi:hypothetical protein
LDGIAGSCGIHNRERKIQKRPLGKLRPKIEENFKMDRKEKGERVQIGLIWVRLVLGKL